MIAAKDMELFDFADDAEDIWAKLVRARPQGAHAGIGSARLARAAFEGFLNAGDGYFQNCRDAIRAPSASAANFAHTTSGSTAACPTQVP